MKKEMEEIPDELNPDLMLNTIASELLIKIAKGEIDIQKLVRKQLSDRGIDDQRQENIGRNIRCLSKPSQSG